MDGQTNKTDRWTNIYSIFRDKLSLPHGNLDCLSQMRIGHQRKQTNMRCAQCRRLIFGILDLERQNRHLLDEDEEICPICQDRLGTEIELGKMICSCTARFHYNCLVQYRRSNPEYNPFLNNGIKCVTCNGIAAGIERITRNRH